MSTTAMPRLKQRYREEIVPALNSEFGFDNIMQVPGVTKVVVNMGVGDAARDSKLIEGAIKEWDQFYKNQVLLSVEALQKTGRVPVA